MNHYTTIHTDTIDGFDIVFSSTPEHEAPDWGFEDEQDRQDTLEKIERGDLTMRTEETTIYQFNELGDRAKDHVRDWYRSGFDYPWWGEVQDSLKSFCDEFGAKVLDYSIGDARREFIKTDATNANFRGLKVKDFDREAMPTGSCFDCDLRYTFAEEFKKHGDALGAFNSALEAFLCGVRNDIEYQLSDEAVDETIEANGYEFTEDGERF